MPQLSIVVAGEGVIIDAVHQETLDKIAALWVPAISLPKRPVLHHLHVDEREQIRANGIPLVYPDLSSELLIQLQTYLVIEALARRPQLLHLHAGCVKLGRWTLLIVGESGSGKSTTTREALRAGASYLTDDCVVVEAGHAYGVARTIQFSARRAHEEVPRYLDDFDTLPFRFNHNGEECYVPLWQHNYQTEPSIELGMSEWIVVQVFRAKEDGVRTLSSLERLRLIHGAVITSGREYSGEFGFGPTYELSWANPERAFALLLAELENAP